MAVGYKESLRSSEKSLSPINIVVDINVIVDGIYGYSSAAETILELLNEGSCRLVFNREIKKEFGAVATGLRIGTNRWNAKLMSPKDRYFVRQLFWEGLDVTGKKSRKSTRRLPTEDQTDTKFVVAARKSNCACIISSDHHLLDLVYYEGFEDITVLTPEKFLTKFGFIS